MIASWRMARNAAVVIILDDDGNCYCMTPKGIKKIGHATRIQQVFDDGTCALVQYRGDTLLVDTGTGRAIRTWHLCGCADATPEKSVAIVRGTITLCLDRGKTKVSTAVNANHGVPIMIRLSAKGFDIVYMKRAGTTITTAVHSWELAETLQCVATTRFKDPFFAFEITPDGKWCCLWPSKGGFVIQNADGHGNSLTSTSPPCCFENATAWIAPAEKNILLMHVSTT